MENSPAIMVRELKKSYGNVRALRGVDLHVQRGEIFGFLGPNGAGKTTTIRCLLDLIRPDSGELRVLGLDPQADSIKVRAQVGYLPGELHIDDNFNVEGALRYLDRLRSGRADWDYVHELADRIDLPLRMPIRHLSKGNKQKVGVLQALMHRPALLILDEPTFGLDPLVQQEVLHQIKDARLAGATVFFSSHILSEVEAIADRVAIIRLGIVVEVADTEQLINRSIRRIHIRFKRPVDLTALNTIPGIVFLTRESEIDITIQVEGELDRLIKTLAAFPVVDFETERPSLEEIFLAYYGLEKTSTSLESQV